ncbi:MAG TPA: pyridoxal phosphate-dependent aminotransferase [Vicinamibacterales bacterium]|nr:pyridoxal phosphate-dependent aminotransferase [Vicinamibacterales bacterium]
MFSSRLPDDLRPNPLAEALARRRAAGLPVIDLTLSNPTRAGFDYPRDLPAALADPGGLVYEPAPLGLPAARAAVSTFLGTRACTVEPERIALVSSTSEAYAGLLKLLCDAGDEVLVPTPSYPLVEYLARLELVRPVPYRLEYAGRWSIDFDSLERALTSRTRAVIVVSPNNPTGNWTAGTELRRLVELAASRDLAIVADEVFADYPFDEAPDPPASVLDQREALAFSLGGLSKSAGLPQLKLSWIAAAGPPPAVEAALRRLEVICDSYLSVSTPVQLALGALLAAGAGVRDAIRARVRSNRDRLARLVAGSPATLLAAEGGWYAVLEVPAPNGEEALALDLLERDGVLVHPGYLFDFEREAFLVIGLLAPEADLESGVRRLLERL